MQGCKAINSQEISAVGNLEANKIQKCSLFINHAGNCARPQMCPEWHRFETVHTEWAKGSEHTKEVSVEPKAHTKLSQTFNSEMDA